MKLSSTALLGIALLSLSACGGDGGGDSSGTATADSGSNAVAACASCHTFNKGGARRAGPNLFGVVGRAAGSVAGFPYSPALKNSGLTWTPEQLDAFLAAPQKVVPGNRMGFPGVTDAAQRKAMVDYLATLK